jgi:hypothetical protein
VRYITSIDEFLKFFGVQYVPDLPDPNTYHDTILDKPIMPPASALSFTDNESFPTTPACSHETYRKERLGFNDKFIWVWRKVR